MTNGTEASEVECGTEEKPHQNVIDIVLPHVKVEGDDKWERLANYRNDIEADFKAGRIQWDTAESCRAVADAIENLYASLDSLPVGHHRREAFENLEASREAQAEDHERS